MYTRLAARSPIATPILGALLLVLVWCYGAWQQRDAVGRRLALIGAVKAADVARVHRLLREGSEVGSERPGGESAVHAALQPASDDPRSRAIAQLLVEKMVSGGVPRHGASLRFALAVYARRSDLLRELLAGAPDADLTDAAMSMALESAIAQDQSQMVVAIVDRLGLARASRLCAPDGPVLCACRFGSTESLRMLLRRFGPNSIDQVSRSPQQPGATGLILALHAVPNRVLPTMSILLQSGADPDRCDARGRTPLHLAALLEPSGRGRDISAPGSEGAEADGVALCAMRLLLEHGANPNIEDDDGITPLMIAVQHHRPDRVRLLLKHGANDPSRPR